MTGCVHARHFGCFTANERAAGFLTARSDTGDHVCRDIGFEMTGCKVIEEEERLSALRQNIVHTHGDEIDADCAVMIGFLSEKKLGPHAVCTRDQHGIFKATGFEVKEAAKPAKIGRNAGALRRGGQRFDAVNQRISRIDINAGLLIGKRSGICHGHALPRLPSSRHILCL